MDFKLNFYFKNSRNEVKVNQFTLILRIINCNVCILIGICVLKEYLCDTIYSLFLSTDSSPVPIVFRV